MEKSNILTIDLGGMSAKCAVFSENEIILCQYTVETRLGLIIEGIYEQTVKELKKANIAIASIKAVGFGCPGLLDIKKGIALKAVNLNWFGYPIKETIVKTFGIERVFLLNDCKAATYGEWQKVYKGAVENLIMYTIGTGIGGSVIINNRLVDGASGMASELGHGGGLQDSVSCTCQAEGCIERISSASGLQILLNEARKEKQSSLSKLYEANNCQDLTVKDVAPLFKAHDEQVWKVFRYGLTPLAKHMGVLIDVLSPNIIVIGGGISNLGQPLLDLLNEQTARYALPEMFKTTKIATAQLKNEAGTYGLYYYVSHQMQKNHQS